MSRALAKTITFRTIATVIDFTTLYVVTQDMATAVGLSAFAFVIGPFVYIGHEKLWDYYGGSAKTTGDDPETGEAASGAGLNRTLSQKSFIRRR